MFNEQFVLNLKEKLPEAKPSAKEPKEEMKEKIKGGFEPEERDEMLTKLTRALNNFDPELIEAIEVTEKDQDLERAVQEALDEESKEERVVLTKDKLSMPFASWVFLEAKRNADIYNQDYYLSLIKIYKILKKLGQDPDVELLHTALAGLKRLHRDSQSFSEKSYE